MEEEPRSEQINGGDEFYEEIEAPKFVDFTTPDHFCPDDRYWFCMRVGCDQKHEEELDSEAIYKNFVLRVMAARSPNVKLRRALNRKSPSSLKCPLTAPAKSSKPRVSRLALISSISHKMVDAKDKVRPFNTKISATTPNVKAKQPSSVAKALTTPRNRKPVANPDTFRSVRNPKPNDVVVPKNRIVAKALVFHSPKKAVKIKGGLECGGNVGKLCAAMKKVEITSGKKHVPGYNKPLPLDTPRKQLRGREVKSRVFDSLHPNKDKKLQTKSLKRKKLEEDSKKCCHSVSCEGVNNGSGDMEPKNSNNGSTEDFSKSVTSKNNEVNNDEKFSKIEKHSDFLLDEIRVKVESETSEVEISSLSSSEENAGKEKINDGNCDEIKPKTSSGMGKTLEHMAEDVMENMNGSGDEDKSNTSSGMGKTVDHKEEDNKENILASNREHDNEIIDRDGKENCITSGGNSEQKFSGQSKRKNLGNHSAIKSAQKVMQVAEKVLKENSTPAATPAAVSAQGVKHSKPKPTHPKPFRFRTDERGMLKEANMEKKAHAPLKEISLDRLPGEKSTEKHHNVIEGKVGDSCLKTLKRDLESKLCNVSTSQKPEKERTTSPMVQQKLARPRGDDSSKRKAAVASKKRSKLSVIKESLSTNVTPMKAAKPCGASTLTNASFRTPSRPLSHRRRPATIPKEPHFHTTHVPKSCTRVAEGNRLN